jgi:hypothetical protein
MPNGEKIWIAQNGERSGPFTEEEVRRAISEGRYGPDTLVWRKGMPDWVPLFSLFPENTATPPPPPAPPKATPSSSAVFATEDRPGSTFSYDEQAPAPAPARSSYEPRDSYSPHTLSRRDLPTPPSLHWGLVFLFTILTLGIFAVVWPFIQANWVRKIDSNSKATPMLAGGLVCLFASEFVSVGSGSKGVVIGGLLTLAYYALWLTAYFSMADSIKRKLAEYSLPVEIGGVTLFFFNTLYLQGQLSWIARWKETGSSNPKPSKGLFYVLLVVPVFVLATLAAIAIPAYQGYVKRAHEIQAQRGE